MTSSVRNNYDGIYVITPEEDSSSGTQIFTPDHSDGEFGPAGPQTRGESASSTKTSVRSTKSSPSPETPNKKPRPEMRPNSPLLNVLSNADVQAVLMVAIVFLAIALTNLIGAHSQKSDISRNKIKKPSIGFAEWVDTVKEQNYDYGDWHPNFDKQDIIHTLAVAKCKLPDVTPPGIMLQAALDRGFGSVNAKLGLTIGDHQAQLSVTPLALAVAKDNTRAVKVLLNAGAAVDHRISQEYPSILSWIVDHENPYGLPMPKAPFISPQITPLEVYVKTEEAPKGLALLVEALANKTSPLTRALHTTILDEQSVSAPGRTEALIKKHLAAGASITDGMAYVDSDGIVTSNVSALALASMTCCTVCVDEMLAHQSLKEPVHSLLARMLDSSASSPIHHAFAAGCVPLANRILATAYHFDADNAKLVFTGRDRKGRNPLFRAIANDQADLIRWALDHPGNFAKEFWKTETDLRPALSLFSPNERNEEGLTPLMYAAIHNAKQCVEALLAMPETNTGMKTVFQDRFMTAEQIAWARGRWGLAEAMSRKESDSFGKTPSGEGRRRSEQGSKTIFWEGHIWEYLNAWQWRTIKVASDKDIDDDKRLQAWFRHDFNDHCGWWC